MIAIEYFDRMFEDRLNEYIEINQREINHRKEDWRYEVSQFSELQKKFKEFIKILGSNPTLDWYRQDEIERAVKSFPSGKKLFLISRIPWDWPHHINMDDYYLLVDPFIYTVYSTFDGLKKRDLYLDFGWDINLFGNKAEISFVGKKSENEEFSKSDSPFATAKEWVERIKKIPDADKRKSYEIVDTLLGDADYLHYAIFDIDKNVSCLISPRSNGMFSIIESALTRVYPKELKFFQ